MTAPVQRTMPGKEDAEMALLPARIFDGGIASA